MLQMMFYVCPQCRDTNFKTFGTILLTYFSTRKICVFREPLQAFFQAFCWTLLFPFRICKSSELYAQIDSNQKREPFFNITRPTISMK